MIRLHLDRVSPTPLYHQIVQAIRWRIGTGALRPGDPLPPIREAAEAWQVNYHTVRRAYHELAAEGWVQSMQGSGTHVAEIVPQRRGAGEELSRWLNEVLEVGAERFGLSVRDLTRLLHELRTVARVVMVECNAHQSTFLARQLEEAWSVEAIPWALEETIELPDLPIIGTYFHHAEMRRRWPHRAEDMHFVALHLDPALKERIEERAAERGARVLRLVEQDPASAREMASGVASLLSSHLAIEPMVGDPDTVLRSLPASELLLVAPRLWDRLAARTREDERVFDVRHIIVPEDLRRVWRTLNSTAVSVGDPAQ